MKGLHSKDKAPKGVQGVQRLKEPDSAPAPQRPVESAKPSGPRSESLLGKHWGKIAMGTAAAVVVGIPFYQSHVQMNAEHPEFSAHSLSGLAQRAYRTAGILGKGFDVLYYRAEKELNTTMPPMVHKAVSMVGAPLVPSLVKDFKAALFQTNGSALAPYAVVCYDNKLVEQAKKGLPHAKAYIAQAHKDLTVELEMLQRKDTPFYKSNVHWDPDAPVPAARFDIEYNQMWYPSLPSDVKTPRPVAQWIVEKGDGVCPSDKVAFKRDLKFGP